MYLKALKKAEVTASLLRDVLEEANAAASELHSRLLCESLKDVSDLCDRIALLLRDANQTN